MTACYIPDQKSPTTFASCRLAADTASVLSQAFSVAANQRSYPSSCVWMVPGTYGEEA